MIFKKTYGDLVQEALSYMTANTSITNTNVGGITRSLIEIINKNIADYYEILDVNMTMGFLSTSQGYFLDLIGTMFNMPRIPSQEASATVSDGTQKFYVTSGTLHDRIPSDQIAANTIVTSADGAISYYIPTTTTFDVAATEVYVPIVAAGIGTLYNVSANTIVEHNLGIADVFTTNIKPIVTGTDTESDANYRYRLINATTSAEKANEISIRLAALSVSGVANVILRPYARGIGTYDVVVVPIIGIANDSLVNSVQTAIDTVQAYGIRGTAIKPDIVPVEIEVSLIFVNGTTDFQKSQVRAMVQSAIEAYIVNIPLGGTFVLNELRQQIMDVSVKIKDHIINCYYFRQEPTFMGNVEIYWNEMFYPDPSISDAIRVV